MEHLYFLTLLLMFLCLLAKFVYLPLLELLLVMLPVTSFTSIHLNPPSHALFFLGTGIVVLPALVDVAGLNILSRYFTSFYHLFFSFSLTQHIHPRRQMDQLVSVTHTLTTTAATQSKQSSLGDRPIILITMFGNSTPCVDYCRKMLEEEGVCFFPVVVFFFSFSYSHLSFSMNQSFSMPLGQAVRSSFSPPIHLFLNNYLFTLLRQWRGF